MRSAGKKLASIAALFFVGCGSVQPPPEPVRWQNPPREPPRPRSRFLRPKCRPRVRPLKKMRRPPSLPTIRWTVPKSASRFVPMPTGENGWETFPTTSSLMTRSPLQPKGSPPVAQQAV